MLSRAESGRKVGENSRDGKLMRDIDVISKGLYVDKNPLRKSINATKSTRKTQFVDSHSKSKSGTEDKEKKSIWNWKPLKAFATDRNRKFNCCFSLQVHFIEGFPLSFNNSSVYVRWKRRDGELSTRPIKVFEGTAEFEQKLMHICTVYGRRSGPHHSAKYEAKHFLLYASVVGKQELDLGKHRVDLTRLLPLTLEELEEEKCSGNWTTSFKLTGEAKGAVLNVSFGYTVVGDNFLAQGNDQSVSQTLSSRNINPRYTKSILKYDQEDSTSIIHRTVSHPGTFHQYDDIPQPVDNIRDLHEVVSTSKSDLVNLAEALSLEEAEDNLDTAVAYKQDVDVSTEQFLPTKQDSFVSGSSQKAVPFEYEDDEYTVTETGITLSVDDKEQVEVTAADVTSVEVDIDCGLQKASKEDNEYHLDDVEDGASETKLPVCDYTIKEEDVCSKESVMKELEAALTSVSKLETEAFDYPEDTETYLEVNNDVETNRMERSLSFDGVSDSLANQFLDMLGIEHSPHGSRLESEPESPRELLLREFEKDVLANGCDLFGFETNDDENETEGGFNASHSCDTENLYDDLELSSFIQAAELEHHVEPQVERNKIRAKALEDLETEVLMHEWGLNDDVFKCSPPKNPRNYGNPIDLPPEEPLELPPLGEGLGPILQTKDGGFLRSMNPSLFKNAKTSGNLIMQVSNPVVVPAERGAGVMDILQQLASVGIEKLSMQANKLMPLEDITGKTVQQVAWDAGAALEGPERQNYFPSEAETQQDISGGWLCQEERSSAQTSKRISSRETGNKTRSEYVSLEDLAPLAMDKIEALSIEGLRIQSGMSDEEAPSNISSQSIGEISALRGKNNSASLGMEGTAGLQLLDIKDSGEDMTGLMDLSLTLDEWLRLDSGDIGDEDEISERTSKILAAHHANSLDMIRGGSKGERRRGKGFGRKCGLLGNNFTVALMVQLRDPLRDYEQVGAPMLALIQVERVFVPPKPRIFRKVSELRNDEEEDEEIAESVMKEEKTEEKASQEEGIPQFKITEVHVAGLKAETGKKSFWGANKQQQSGSRWLLANGMGKSNKHPLMKSKTVSSKSAAPSTSKPQANESLWSISSRVNVSGAKSKAKDLAAPKPHIRNPNIYFC